MATYEQEYVDTWVSHAVVGIVATVVVALRFYARRRQKAVLSWDDWFALLALVTMWGDFACAIWGKNFFSHLTQSKELTITAEYTPGPKYNLTVENLNKILQVCTN
jgi:hypothetical protein